jgi:hypothetical protein
MSDMAVLSCYRNLGLGILGQAARDWRMCEKPRKPGKINVPSEAKVKKEIMRFLTSPYFEDLCDLIEVDSGRTKRAIIEKWGEKEKVYD